MLGLGGILCRLANQVEDVRLAYVQSKHIFQGHFIIKQLPRINQLLVFWFRFAWVDF